VARWVIKQLSGLARREAEIYQALKRTGAEQTAPTLIAVLGIEAGALELYVEQVVSRGPWPWKDVATAASVLECVATLHESATEGLAARVSDWDYELELQERAAELLEVLQRHRRQLQDAGVALRMSLIRRILQNVPRLRAQLAREGPLPSTVIHGDLHPGNAIIRRQRDGDVAILIDWARARVGSPLEDVSSWLQSLGFWEPEARRRHDTLLAAYLQARGISPVLTRPLRDAYWLSACSNCLAGSLLYHVGNATSRGISSESRYAALGAVRDQLRVLRRADACCS
jgi:Ser/Thr protein kinase RdoA (MazF antagonist)